MTATIHHLPPIPAEPAPPWDVNNPVVIKLAESLARHRVTPDEAFEAAALCQEYLPVAAAMKGMFRSAEAILKAPRR